MTIGKDGIKMITLSVGAGQPNPARTRAGRRAVRRTNGGGNEQPISVMFERADGTTITHVYRPGGGPVPRL